jgi:hypothetical protein
MFNLNRTNFIHPDRIVIMSRTSLSFQGLLGLALLCGSFVLAQLAAAKTVAKSRSSSFLELCRNRARISADAKFTVEVLLKKAETTNCQAADRKLRASTELNLDSTDIKDLQPLSSFTHL